MNISLYTDSRCQISAHTLSLPDESPLIFFTAKHLTCFNRLLVNSGLISRYKPFYQHVLNRFVPTPLYSFSTAPSVFLSGSYFLLENYYWNNYAHTTLQTLGAYLFAKNSGYFFRRRMKCAAYRLNPVQKKLFATFGIDERRIVILENDVRYTFEECSFSNLYIDTDAMHGDVIESFARERDALLGHQAKKGQTLSLFIDRAFGVTRKAIAINADKVRDFLRSLAYSPVDTARLPIREQMELFAQAKRIVAWHGAGGANLVYADRGFRVLEIFSESWIKNYSAKILPYKECAYSGLVSPAIDARLERDADFTVDIDLLCEALAQPNKVFHPAPRKALFVYTEEELPDEQPEVESLLSLCTVGYRLIHEAQEAYGHGEVKSALAYAQRARDEDPDNLFFRQFLLFLQHR
ncbi:MAG: glycosyltransferase family 61 protein [Desulfovibrionaceae bacterium]|nr:glycosyltransferase family 61 protein [Desulfovibrionaceae bacterium]